MKKEILTKTTSWIHRMFPKPMLKYIVVGIVGNALFIGAAYKFFVSLNHTSQHSLQYAIATSAVVIVIALIVHLANRI